MAFSGKRSPAIFNARLACDKDGKIVAGEFDSGLDNGAYPEMGDDKLTKILRFLFFPYYVPNEVGLARSAVTNHNFGVPYRGYGAPQAYTCGEALIDMMAEEIGWIRSNSDTRTSPDLEIRNLNQRQFLQYPMEEMMDTLKPLYEEAVKKAKAEDTPESERVSASPGADTT